MLADHVPGAGDVGGEKGVERGLHRRAVHRQCTVSLPAIPTGMTASWVGELEPITVTRR